MEVLIFLVLVVIFGLFPVMGFMIGLIGMIYILQVYGWLVFLGGCFGILLLYAVFADPNIERQKVNYWESWRYD